jgi:hypothetical protein
LGYIGKLAAIAIFAILGGSIIFVYYPEFLPSRKTTVRITSNTYWWGKIIYMKNSDDTKGLYYPDGKGNYTYEIDGKVTSMALLIDNPPIGEKHPPNRYVQLEIIERGKIIFSERSKTWINWIRDIKGTPQQAMNNHAPLDLMV